eukprot:gnl/TRDRNA2_/TRDRNA2_130923_c0_seq1.p1 gnl/TRDRNA2_/TRDRNA2_130923_c0~~gnl/TRDRNA2_/TRDRNA2_130923_c0_seq1.p1  ORF type:complete len:540 (+),score=77.06 gnl/TRDRNA2_/TRDRNA2_130923_c0_seq1:194-1621(+)
MEFDELVVFLRRPFPGLSLSSQKELSDDDLRGLWRSLDADLSGRVTTREFTLFMRIHGKALSMHKVTQYSMKCRGLEEPQKVVPPPPPPRTREQLAAIAQALDEALAAYNYRRGIQTNLDGDVWEQLFRHADAIGQGCLSYDALETALRDNLRPAAPSSGHKVAPSSSASHGTQHQRQQTATEPVDGDDGIVVKGVTRDDMRALFVLVDANGSGAVSAKEFQLGLYRIQVDMWPDATADTINHVVEQMDRAAAKWHHAGGNWYRIFRLIDSDHSGMVCFEQLRAIVYRPVPCLAISQRSVSVDALRGLWKELDKDLSGKVTTREFMVFMRRHSKKGGTTRCTTERSGSLPPQQWAPRRHGPSTADAGSEGLTLAQIALLGGALVLQTKQTYYDMYASWGVATWDGHVSEWDFLAIVRQLLGLKTTEFDDDAVHTVWTALDLNGTGKVSVHALFTLGHELVKGSTEARGADAVHLQ